MAKHNRYLKTITVMLLTIILCVNSLPSISYADDAPRRSRVIVSMGDSYSSGEGVEPFWDDYAKYIETGKDDRTIEEKIEDKNWLAHRSIWAWSGQLILPDVGVVNLTKHNEDPNWYFVASSGAETKHILSEGQYKPIKKGKYETSKKDGTATRLQPQINIFKELNSMNITPDYVTLTIGGNDAGFQDIITIACLSYYAEKVHLPGGVELSLNYVWDQFGKKDGIRDNLKKTYNRIFEETGENTCILVGGYPLLFSPEDFDSNTPINQDDAIDINISVHRFNKEIEKLIEECKKECKKKQKKEMNIEFVSVEKAFGENGEHGAYSKEPFINEIMLKKQPEDINETGVGSSYSVHPNIYGICAYRDCFQEKINENEKKRDKNLPDDWIDEYKANAIDEDSIGIGKKINDTPTIAPTPKLTEEQAKLAYKYYMVEEIIGDYYDLDDGTLNLNVVDIGEDYCDFSWETDDHVVEYHMNLNSGLTTSSEYSTSDYVISSEGEYDFNAWDYLNNPPQISYSEAMEVRQFVGADLYEAVDSLGYLEDFQEDLEDKWNSGRYYITKSCDDIWDLGYYLGFQNDDIHFWTFDADLDINKIDSIFCVTVKTDAYSIYGVSPGMSWEEAVDCCILSGAYEIISTNNNGAVIRMGDGNLAAYSFDDEQNVRLIYVGNPNNKKAFPGTDGGWPV